MKNTIRRLLAAALVCCLVLGALPFAGFAASVEGFGDVAPDDWFYGDVRFVSERELMIGTSELSFSPELVMSRAMLTTVLYRLAGSPVVEATAVFADVSANLWYSDAITWASENHVVEGYGNDLFGPNDPITREQLVTMLYQYADKTGSDITENKALDSFNDAAEVHEWALDAMQWAYAAGVVIGRSGQRLAPQCNATRAEAAAMLHRFVEACATENASEEPAETEKFVFSSALCADEIYHVAGAETTIHFTVSTELEFAEITLASGEAELGKMYDDGTHGDMVAADGEYTVDFTAYADTTSEQSFYAVTNEQRSEPETIYFFAQPTEEEAAEMIAAMKTVKTELAEIEASYTDDTGSVPPHKKAALMEDISSYLKRKQEEGVVLHFEIENYSAYIKFTSGLAMLYMPNSMDTDNAGDSVSLTVVTCQPCFTDMGGANYQDEDFVLPQGVNYLLEMTDDAANDTAAMLPNVTGVRNYDDEAVSLSLIKSFGKNQVILWHGHGYYGPCVRSCLVTGELFDETAYYWDMSYFADCVDNAIVNSWILDSDTVVISSKYIKRYCGELDGSLVYLAACSSGKHASLANAFLDKHAAAVVAMSDNVKRTYDVALQYETIENMSRINPETDNYFTLSEALAVAKRTYGADDSDPRYGGTGAEALIFGGENAENYRLASATIGTLTGKICAAQDRTSAIGNASIQLYRNDRLFAAAQSDSGGFYQCAMPAGRYRIEVSAAGYLNFSAYIDIVEGETTYTETFLMVEGDAQESGTATGTVFNALTGSGIEGVSVIARAGWNNTAEGAELNPALLTDASGGYSITLPLGNYTLELSKDGYITSYINIIVQSGTTADQNGTMSPVITGDSFRIVLSWGANPSDLDSHVEGMRTNGTWFHVYYADQYAYDGDVRACDLDVDDTTSYGPETITLNTTTEAPYYYYVHKYAGNGTLPTSEAKVRVYQGEALIAEYNVPTDLEAARYWNVFAIVNGQIVTRNTMTSAPELHYAE